MPKVEKGHKDVVEEGGNNKERKYCFHSVSSERQAWLSESEPGCFSWLPLPPSSPVDYIFGQNPMSTLRSSAREGGRDGEVARLTVRGNGERKSRRETNALTATKRKAGRQMQFGGEIELGDKKCLWPYSQFVCVFNAHM